jgi:putative methyltransferase (TIGR04325 family)
VIIDKIKAALKMVIPPVVIRSFTGLFYGWHGNYSNWGEARVKSTGYDSTSILEKVSASARGARDDSSKIERDSVLFRKSEYPLPVLCGLLWSAAVNNGKLNVLDFGGSLGSTYYQNKLFLDAIGEVNWCIVEQAGFVREGKENFANERLHFFYSVEDCIRTYKINVVLLSGVLQYLEKPYEQLETIFSYRIEHLIVDRTPFIRGKERITIQRVHPSIYKATYPCWFFNKSMFLSLVTTYYDLVLEFDALDKANIQSEFKGFIFRLR